MSIAPSPPTFATAALVTVFGRLFESEFVTLERFAISCRAEVGFRYLDESVALARLLGVGDPEAPFEPADRSLHALHRAMYEAWPEFVAVVSGPSRHLRSLMAEGCAMPECTSMMRKRGVTRLDEHVVADGDLDPPQLAVTLARARATAAANGMKHVLIIEAEGTVHVAGPRLEETMAHYSNVEFSARVACTRIEEAVTHRRDA